MPVNAGEVRAKITGDASSFTSAASGVVSSLGTVKGAFKGALAAGTAFAGFKFFQSAITQASQFEEKMSDISTLMSGDVRGQIKGMKRDVQEMSQQLPVSPDELGTAAYDVLSAGVEGSANQMKVLEESAKLAVGGLGSTEQAVDLMTTALNSFNFSADEAGRVANVFFKTVDEGKNTVADLSDFFGQVAPLAKQAGISFEEINAATAVMTRRTGNARKAQRGLRQILNALMKPSDELKKLYDEMGANTFPDLIDRSGGLQKALQRIKDETSNIQEFSQLVGSSRALSSALLQVGEAGKETQNIIRSMKNDVSALEEAVARQTESSAKQWQLVQNEVENLMIEMGDELLPVVKDLLPALRSTAETLQFVGRAASDAARGIDFVLENAAHTLTGMETDADQARRRMAELQNQTNELATEMQETNEIRRNRNDLTDEQERKLNQLTRSSQKRIRALKESLRNEDGSIKQISTKRFFDIKRQMKSIREKFTKESKNMVERFTEDAEESTKEAEQQTKKANQNIIRSTKKTTDTVEKEFKNLQKKLEKLINADKFNQKVVNSLDELSKVKADEKLEAVRRKMQEINAMPALSDALTKSLPGAFSASDVEKVLENALSEAQVETIIRKLIGKTAEEQKRVLQQVITEGIADSVDEAEENLDQLSRSLSDALGVSITEAREKLESELGQDILDRTQIQKAIALKEWGRAGKLAGEQFNENAQLELEENFTPGQFIREQLQAPIIEQRLNQLRQQERRGPRQRKRDREKDKEQEKREKIGAFRARGFGTSGRIKAKSKEQARQIARELLPKKAKREARTSSMGMSFRQGPFPGPTPSGTPKQETARRGLGIGVDSPLASDQEDKKSKAGVQVRKTGEVARQANQGKQQVRQLKKQLKQSNRLNGQLIDAVGGLAQELSDEEMKNRINGLLKNADRIQRTIQDITNN